MTAHRSMHEVFERHLRLRQERRLEEDLALNYAPDVQLTATSGLRRGHDGVRAGAREPRELLPRARFKYRLCAVEGEVAFLVWDAESTGGCVRSGADTFLIRDGKIAVQTIHYRIDGSG